MPSSTPGGRIRPSRAPALAALGLVLLRALPAPAQTTPSDEAFLQGKALMEQGKTGEACRKFAESLALERRGGTLLNLGVCWEKEGHYASALRVLHEARVRALKDGHADRAELADASLQRVEGKLSWLTVRLAPHAAAPDLTIQCDGEDLPSSSWGTLRAVDPGQHTVLAAAAGRPRFEVTVQVGPAGDTQVVEIPAAPAPPPPRESAASPASAPTWIRPVGGVVAGLGAALLVVGAVFGAEAIHEVQESDPLCPGDACTTPAAVKENGDAHTAARISDVAIPTGLALTGAGLYLLLRRSPQPAASPSAVALLRHLAPDVAPGVTRFSVRGAW